MSPWTQDQVITGPPGAQVLAGRRQRIAIRAAVIVILLSICLQPHRGQTAGPEQRTKGRETEILTQVESIQFQPWELGTAVAWSPDGQLLAAGVGESVRLLALPDLKVLDSFWTGAFTHSLAFSPDGQRLAAGSRDGLVRVWSLANETRLGTPSLVITAHRKGVNCVVFSPDGTQLATGGNDAIARIWDLSTGKRLTQIIGGSYAVPSLAYTPGGEALAVMNGAVVRLRSPLTGQMLGTLRSPQPLYSLAFSPDGAQIALGDHDNTVEVWNTTTGFRKGSDTSPTPVPGILTGHTGTSGSFRALVWDVVFSPDNRLVVSAGGDTTLRVWDVASGKLLATLSGHTLAVTGVAFRSDGKCLASSSLDATIRIWCSPGSS